MEDGRPWSQQYLGQRSGLGTVIIGKIERGERQCLSEDVLIRLMDALELTSSERREFLLAATGVEKAHLSRGDQSKEEVLDKLMAVAGHIHTPAYIVDNYCDLLSTNRAALEILALDVEGLRLSDVRQHPLGLNMLYFVVSPVAVRHFQALMQDYWINYVRQNMLLFRTCTLRYRADPYFRQLLRGLRRYRYFRRYWHDVLFEERDHFMNNEILHLVHPQWGPLTFFSTTITALSVEGELYLCTYVPTDHHTAEVFFTVTQGGGAEMLPLKTGRQAEVCHNCRPAGFRS